MTEQIPNDARILIDKILGIEGGYSNHSADPGGETMHGISKRWWPGYWDDGPPTVDEAREFYYVEFYRPLKCANIESFPIKFELLDTAVNMAHEDAVLIAQRAYNTVRPEWRPAITVDGAIGPETLWAINWYAGNSRTYETVLYRAMNGYQFIHYARQNNLAMIRGWISKRIGGLPEIRAIERKLEAA